jgi:hypothetical protein
VKNQPRVFLPALLAEPGIHLLLGRREGLGVASAVLNRTGAWSVSQTWLQATPTRGPYSLG